MAHTSRCETADPDSRCECSCGGEKHGIANSSSGSTSGGTSDDEINPPELDARIFRNLDEGDAFDFHFVNRTKGTINGGGTFRIKEWFSGDEAILENPESKFEERVRVGSKDHLLYYEGDQLAGTLGNIRPVDENEQGTSPEDGIKNWTRVESGPIALARWEHDETGSEMHVDRLGSGAYAATVEKPGTRGGTVWTEDFDTREEAIAGARQWMKRNPKII